jgi:propionate CoA-transferase
MHAPSIVTAEQAASHVRDADTVIVGGSGGTGAPEAVLEALEHRFLSTGRPHALTLFHVTGIGAVTEKGLCRLAHEGLVARVIGGNFGLQLPFMKLIVGDRIEAYNFPQGVMTQMCRAMAAKQPGVVTHVGLGTYMDPRQDGGKMNRSTREELVEVVNLVGREWLFYRAPVPNVAIIRGTTADEDGYVAMEHEGTTREDLSIAQAVHNAGGTVICQVKRLTKRGALHPQMVKIPGFLIDYVVLAPDQKQTYGTVYDPSRSGDMPIPVSTVRPDPLTERRIIARRAALELRRRDVVNLGVGISAMIPNVAAEEGIEDLITFTVESGVIGGIPGHGREFGTAVNPRAIIDQPYQFDFYDGGGLTCAFLSFAEVDAEGNVNVTRFGNRYDGAGGFIDISQNAQRLVFSGTFTGGGLDIAVTGGRLAIRKDGTFVKFVRRVGQVSFNGARAREHGQSVTIVSERAVFRFVPEGLVLIEIAPGVRLEEDVLAKMAFRPHVAPDLRPMDDRLFRDGAMGLAETFAAAATD